LKKERKALNAVGLEKRNCLCVLSTGFGKSLIVLFLSLVDCLEKVNNGCILVVSPLNAIISDKIEKLKLRIVGVQVFKQGYPDVIPSLETYRSVCRK